MNKFGKKILALLLAVMCIATIGVVSASAKIVVDGKSTYNVKPYSSYAKKIDGMGKLVIRPERIAKNLSAGSKKYDLKGSDGIFT